MRKRILISVATLAVLVLGAFGLVSCGRGKTTISNTDFTKSWQSHIDGTAKITDIVMPGTHDAGTKGALSLVENQNITIYEQLLLGVRYFDLRVKISGGKAVIFHSVATGLKFDEVLADFKRFGIENPGEVVILDFQHFESSAEQTVADMLSSTLDIENTAVKVDGTDISTLTIGSMREAKLQYIVTWGSKTMPDSKVLFYRPRVLISPYDDDDHKVKPDAMIAKFPDYFARSDGSTIFVLQGQLTPNGLQTPWSLEKNFCDPMNTYLKSLATDAATLDKLNVVMRDFIDYKVESVKIILSLNLAKSLVNADSIAAFTKAVKLD